MELESWGVSRTSIEKRQQVQYYKDNKVKTNQHFNFGPAMVLKRKWNCLFSFIFQRFRLSTLFSPIYLDCETRPYYLLSTSIKTRFSISTTFLAFIKRRRRRNEVDSLNPISTKPWAKERNVRRHLTYTQYKYSLFVLLLDKLGLYFFFLWHS